MAARACSADSLPVKKSPMLLPIAVCIIAMLVGYYDVHIYMAAHPEQFASLPLWALYARLPLQLVLIAWAWVYARGQRATEA